jgi:predicted nucleotidyltransferase
MILSLVLFGSRARGDQRDNSDVDLLGIEKDGNVGKKEAGDHTSFFRYPIATLHSFFLDGDLFALHLKLEGQILYDTQNLFSDARDQFRYRDTYSRELREASGIIWFISDQLENIQTELSRRKLIWAIRTILIARLTEQRTPAFSSSALADFAKNPRVKSIIDNRYSEDLKNILHLSNEIASTFGISRTQLHWPNENSLQAEALRSLGSMAKTILHATRPSAQSATKNLDQHHYLNSVV